MARTAAIGIQSFETIISGNYFYGHIHCQGLAKTPWTGDQGNAVAIFPPLSDEICFIHIEVIARNNGFKTLYPDLKNGGILSEKELTYFNQVSENMTETSAVFSLHKPERNLMMDHGL